MIKYTGYGNAAGMFADRGLLGCGCQGGSTPYHSSDCDVSETEEYSAYKGRINPIVGCYEPPKADPTNGMTEEQKECEALRLANMMDKLARDGLIQPCRIGEDGRPEPVEHVLQMQEDKNGLVKKYHLNSSDHSDED